MNFCKEVIEFYQKFENGVLPEGVVIHNPISTMERRIAIDAFYEKYFDDEKSRVHVIGINPSKINNTSTGVNYTDGFALLNYCGINNDFSKSRELTADFFYKVVMAAGGSEIFYKEVFPWALMPLSITKDGSYINYYDCSVQEALKDIVEENMRWVSKLPSRGRLVVLGKGENLKSFKNLSGTPFGYNTVLSLPHPRWIMQYNRDKVDQYIDIYLESILG